MRAPHRGLSNHVAVGLLSANEPARAVVDRNHPAEQDLVEPFIPQATM